MPSAATPSSLEEERSGRHGTMHATGTGPRSTARSCELMATPVGIDTVAAAEAAPESSRRRRRSRKGAGAGGAGASGRALPSHRKQSFGLFLSILPLLVMVFLFSYLPLYGWIYSLFDYRPARGL